MLYGRGLEDTYERGLWLFDRLRDRGGRWKRTSESEGRERRKGRNVRERGWRNGTSESEGREGTS